VNARRQSPEQEARRALRTRCRRIHRWPISVGGLAGGCGPGLRTIAAKLSSVEASINEPSPSPANGSIAGKKNRWLACLKTSRSFVRTNRSLICLSRGTTRVNRPAAQCFPNRWSRLRPKSEAKTGTLGLPDVSTQLEGSALFAGLTQTRAVTIWQRTLCRTNVRFSGNTMDSHPAVLIQGTGHQRTSCH